MDSVTRVSIAKGKLEELENIPLEAVEDKAEKIQLNGDVEFIDVHFKHDQSEVELLNGVSLNINQGETIGITGPNGCGKSTLIELLMGFMLPSHGEVKIDGRDIRTLDRSSLRAQIGYMPQHGVIFEGTILDNMTMFREGAVVDRALQIADKLGLTEVIMRMPEGLDTRVSGTNYDSLPVGVRQQIILVRSLVGCMTFGEPKIILFDDADSSLDFHHDKLLVKMLVEMQKKYTMVIASHRPSILRICDRNYVMESGELIMLPWLSGQKANKSTETLSQSA